MTRRQAVPLAEGEIPSSSTSACRSCCSLLWNLLRCFNTFAVAILASVVTILFLQVQYLTYTVQQNEHQLQVLQLQVANYNDTQGQINHLQEDVQKEHSLALLQMAGTVTVLTCLLTMFHMTQHMRNFHQPVVQRKILVILWMSPIYALTSFFSLLFPAAEGYLAVLKDFYEAYVVYNFLAFLIAVLGRGDREAVVTVLALRADELDRPAVCLRSCFHPPPETSARATANAVLMECMILAMQFVFIRPLTSIGNFVADTVREDQAVGDDVSTPWSWSEYVTTPNFYMAVITNISVFLAFAGLLKFYHAVRDELAWCQPFSKFCAIKGIVFLTFWQGLVIAIWVALQSSSSSSSSFQDAQNQNDRQLHRQLPEETSSATLTQNHVLTKAEDPGQQAAAIQNFLICLEMLFFSIAHWCVFPAEEWEPNYRPRRFANPGMGLKDFVSDVSYIMSSKGAKSATTSTFPEAASLATESLTMATVRPMGHDALETLTDDGTYQEEGLYYYEPSARAPIALEPDEEEVREGGVAELHNGDLESDLHHRSLRPIE